MNRLKFFFIVVFIFVFSSGVVAAENDYWDNFMQSAATTYDFGHGVIDIKLMPLEFDQNDKVSNGLDTQVMFDFGIYKHLELYGYMTRYTGFTNLVGELKYQCFATPRFTGAVMGRMFTVYKDFTTPSLKLLLDTNLTENISLHNAFQLYLYESGVIGKHLDTGIKYTINDKHAIQTRFKVFFVESLFKSLFDFRVAYRYTINRQTTYYFYTYFDVDNVHLENVVEFKPIPPLKLNIGLVVNSGEWRNDYDGGNIVTDLRHWATVKTEYTLTKNFLLSGEYRKEAAADGYSYFKLGLDFKI